MSHASEGAIKGAASLLEHKVTATRAVCHRDLDPIVCVPGERRIMGRTLATFTQLVQQEIARWRRYRRALRAEDQQALDELFAAARRHSAAGAYLARDAPFEVMLLSMVLEQHKQLQRLARAVADHDARSSLPPSHRVAP
jgi:hypothetical protein